MGTEGACGFIIKEEPKLSYNHFDSYPDVLGQNCLSIISKINKDNGWKKLKNNILKIKEIESSDVNDDIIKKYKKYSNLGVSQGKYEDLYCLFRNIQKGDWIYEIYKGELKHFYFQNNFIKDSLFCEYAYIINFDTMMFEYYEGFQKNPQKDNFFGEKPNSNGYYPCKLIDVLPLKEIEDKDIDTITNKWNEEEDLSNKTVNNYLKHRLKISRNMKIEQISGK